MIISTPFLLPRGPGGQFIDNIKREKGNAYSKQKYKEFAVNFFTLGKKKFEVNGFSQNDELIQAENEGYEKQAEAIIGRGAGANPERLGYRYGTKGRSDLQRRSNDLLYKPSQKAVANFLKENNLPKLGSEFPKPFLNDSRFAADALKKKPGKEETVTFRANEKLTAYTKEGSQVVFSSARGNTDDGPGRGDIRKKIANRENNPTLRKLQDGEWSRIERKYSVDKNFRFTGKDKIESLDVATTIDTNMIKILDR